MTPSTAPSSALHVLVLPSWFPEDTRPYQGLFFVDQAHALRQAGHRVGVIYPLSSRGAPDYGLDVMRGQVRFISKAGPLNALAFALETLRLYRLYSRTRGRPDVVHVQSSLWAGLSATLIQRAHRIPTVVTEHLSGFANGDLRAWKRRLALFSLRRANATIAVSRSLAHALSAHGLDSAIEVVPNTVDTSYFSVPHPAHRERTTGFVVVCIGNLIPLKRTDLALRAFAAAFGKESDTRLEIAGAGPQHAPLVQLARELGIHERVLFIGQASRSRVRAALQHADILLHCSDVETFGVVLIEALACGVPVVATRSGGPDDIVTPPVGTLVDCGDSAGLAHALCATRTRLEQEGASWRGECASFAHQHYSYEAFAKRMAPILRAATATGSGGAHRARTQNQLRSV